MNRLDQEGTERMGTTDTAQVPAGVEEQILHMTHAAIICLHGHKDVMLACSYQDALEQLRRRADMWDWLPAEADAPTASLDQLSAWYGQGGDPAENWVDIADIWEPFPCLVLQVVVRGSAA